MSLNNLPSRNEWHLETDAPFLFHGTTTVHVDAILKNGLVPGTHFGSRFVADYFANKTCEESGGDLVMIAIPIAAFSTDLMEIDEQMVDFPIFDDWDYRSYKWGELDDATPLDCLRLYEAMVYQGAIPINHDMLTVYSSIAPDPDMLDAPSA